MATVNKDFKIKSGLIVEGTSATVNGNQVLTENASDSYIIDLIGGETLVTSVNSTQLEVVNGELSVKSGVFDADGAAEAAETAANSYTDGKIADEVTRADGAYDAYGAAANAESAAIASAQDYTDAEISDEIIARDAAIGVALDSAENYADTVSGNAYTDATQYTDSAISTEVTNRNSAIASAKQEAIDTAENTAASLANTAESNANSYTDDEITALEGRSQSYADAAAQTAEDNAKTYADGLSSGLAWKQAVNVLATTNTGLSGASPISIDGHTLSDGYRVLLTGQSTDSENGIYEVSISGGSFTLSRPADADTAGELIGAAVFVMEGDNYASTAWVQADHYLTDFTGQEWTQFSGQGTYLAGNGISLDGTTFSIDTTVTATKAYADDAADAAETAANSYTDGRETAITTAYQNYADQAETDANNYAEGLIETEVMDRNNAINSAIDTEVTNRNNAIATAKSEAITDANNHSDGLIADEITDRNNAIDNAINALTTDDIEEGNNLYFTNSLAQFAAANLLTNATLTNITIEGSGNGLTITAENGVADSDTDDLAEGSTNLYLTTERVIDIIDINTITPIAVEINNYRKEEATQQYVASASTVNVHQLSGMYESVKYLVRVVGQDSGVKHSQITEILMTIDGNGNIAITEYGNVHTSTNPLATFSAVMLGAGVPTLTATTAVSGCEIIAAATMLSWAD